MGQLGDGTGSTYPGTLDTAGTEVDSPNVGKTKARADVPNDIYAAVVAVETELGTDPAGSLADVKTYLQTEHNTDGTHGTIGSLTATVATVTGATALNGGLTMDTNKFTVANTTGDTLIAGTLDVTGLDVDNSSGTYSPVIVKTAAGVIQEVTGVQARGTGSGDFQTTVLDVTGSATIAALDTTSMDLTASVDAVGGTYNPVMTLSAAGLIQEVTGVGARGSDDSMLMGALSISQGAIISGTYTPSLTDTTNVAASTAFPCQYMRVGAVVTVSGYVDVDVTAGETATALDISLPIATTFSNDYECGGTAVPSSRISAFSAGGIRANTVANIARLAYFSGTSTSNESYFFSFTYQII